MGIAETEMVKIIDIFLDDAYGKFDSVGVSRLRTTDGDLNIYDLLSSTDNLLSTTYYLKVSPPEQWPDYFWRPAWRLFVAPGERELKSWFHICASACGHTQVW